MRIRAFLISGTFRVHAAGCGDGAKDALRSDSAGHPEEHASQDAVIASLRAGIIDENPALYGTEGGLASLAAGTRFCGCTRGLPRHDPPPAPAPAGSPPPSGLYCAFWAERARPGGGCWMPLPFEQARSVLASQLRRNLNRWAGTCGTSTRPHEQALERVETATGPLTLALPGAILGITPAHG